SDRSLDNLGDGKKAFGRAWCVAEDCVATVAVGHPIFAHRQSCSGHAAHWCDVGRIDLAELLHPGENARQLFGERLQFAIANADPRQLGDARNDPLVQWHLLPPPAPQTWRGLREISTVKGAARAGESRDPSG